MTTELSLSQKLKYYGPNDLATFLNAKDVLEFIDDFEPKKDYDINEILALRNCVKYLANQNFMKNLSEDKRDIYVNKKRSIEQKIGRYWAMITQTNFRSLLANVDKGFYEDLIESIMQYDIQEVLSNEELMELLDMNGIPLYFKLKNKELVEKMDAALCKQITSNVIAGAECIIDAKLLGGDRERLYLPQNLTCQDINTLMQKYIVDDQSNCNYLQLIAMASKDTGISDKTKLAAKRAYKQRIEKLFSQQQGIQYGIKVGFCKNQDEPLRISQDGHTLEYSISESYLDSRLDFESIIINLASIFGMIEPGHILSLPSYPSEMGTLEKALTIHGKNDYLIGHAFQMKEKRMIGTVSLYDKYLKSKGIEIESVIQWFFAEYLNKIFHVPSFMFNSSTSNSYYEKAKNIFTEMEGVARQAKMFFEEGYVDQELLGMSSTKLVYSDIPSLSSKKYLYANQDNEEITKVLHWLFSDQSHLSYIDEHLKENNLVLLLTKHRVLLSNFHNYQKPMIMALVKLGVLSIGGEDYINFADGETISLLDALHRLGAIAYLRCADDMREKADSMILKGWLVSGDTLLTRQEAEYFDYCLNNRKFSNGLALRNKYLHGSESYSKDENEHAESYYHGIILTIALAIKIYDDFVIQACA